MRFLRRERKEPMDNSLKANGATPGVARRLGRCIADGASKGLRTALWLVSIMIPISLAVMLLQHFGVLAYLAPALGPVFRYLGLPGETAVALLTSALLNLYSGIAALSVIPLTDRQVTILALMMLICHNVPAESVIQHKAGTPLARMVVLRIVVSFAGGVLLNRILPAGDPAARIRGTVEIVSVGFWPALGGWALGAAELGAKICLIVVGLMIVHRLLREFKVIGLLAVPLTPLLWALGLSRRSAFLWIVANFLGLAYGSAIILEDIQSGALGRKDAQRLNRSIAVCHSLLEDTLLFVAVGAWAFWITVPRLALAALVVWTYRTVTILVRKSDNRVLAD